MKAKALISIIVTLLIGIILGFLVSAQLRHKRMRSVRVFSSERYFREVLYKVIEPTDELKNQLEPIIDRYGKEGKELQKEFRRSFDTHTTNYWSEIKELLSEDQLNKLDEFNKQREKDRRRFRQDTSKGQGGERDRRRDYPSGPGHSKGMRDSLRFNSDTLQIPDKQN